MSKLRKLNQDETTKVETAFRLLLGEKVLEEIFSSYTLLLRGKTVFMIRDNVWNQFLTLQEDIVWIGARVGRLSKEFFVGVEILDKIAPFAKKKAIVAELGEKRFLYGRNLKIQDISIIGDIKVEEKVIVFNSLGEPIGIGQWKAKNLQNLGDKGVYLRREKSFS